MTLFKKISVLLLLFFTVLAFAKENYEVVLLGDLHYDSADIRKDVEKLTAGRKREMQRNLHAWGKNIPAVLNAAKNYATQPSVLFTVQCGDITQGDEGSYEFARTSFERVLKIVNDGQKKPVYVVRGNHDIRGVGKEKAGDEVLTEYMKKQQVNFPLPGKTQTSYKIVGKDLFIFFDSMKESLPALELALKAKPDARHIFLFCHIPMMPCTFSSSSFNWICGRYSKDGDKIRSLIAKHKIIVLTAHTHVTSYFRWNLPEGPIRQFVSFSIGKDPGTPTDMIKYTGSEYFRYFEKTIIPKLKEKDQTALRNVQKRYIGKLDNCVQYKGVAGFNVLRIEGDKVFVDIYCGDLSKKRYTQTVL